MTRAPLPFWHDAFDESEDISEIVWRKHFGDEDLFQTESDNNILTPILKNARNCHTIVLCEGERPWGAENAKKEIGYYPTTLRVTEDDVVECTRIFTRRAINMMFTALHLSKARITTLAVQTIRDPIEPSMLSLSDFSTADTPWIASLKELILHVDAGQDVDAWADHLCQFIARFLGLETLDLSFEACAEADFAALNRVLTLPRIRTLKLSDVVCPPQVLLEFLLKQRDTLEEITLEGIDIDTREGGSWHSVLTAIRDELPFSSFRMKRCYNDGKEVWMGEGDRVIS
ncbi:hypothetical protein N7476_005044 [Penicillium atrosanguineum]|uniref:Uncharacterized protein n=1 Tax=Penicillium atrosanguineum TaxID=1132637 RepID=A0A9W9U541_9EURO|nr:hypothetical protein N7476_005044 [Penicillium atrosanguineum]